MVALPGHGDGDNDNDDDDNVTRSDATRLALRHTGVGTRAGAEKGTEIIFAEKGRKVFHSFAIMPGLCQGKCCW